MLNWLLTLVLIAAAGLLFLRWFERSNVYQPTRTWFSTGEVLNRPWEAIEFPTVDGCRISAWFFPARPTDAFHDIAVMVSHGNGGNISHRLALCELLLELGVNVLLYDYRGYGQSTGRPTEAGTYLDGEAALQWLHTRGFDDGHIVLHGESLGGAIAAELALRHPGLRGVILQSTFTSLRHLGSELFPFLPVRWLSTIHYDTLSKLPRTRVPVLILHSQEDTLIGFHHAEANFRAANEPRYFREIHGDHNDQPAASPGLFLDAMREFLQAIPAPRN